MGTIATQPVQRALTRGIRDWLERGYQIMQADKKRPRLSNMETLVSTFPTALRVCGVMCNPFVSSDTKRNVRQLLKSANQFSEPTAGAHLSRIPTRIRPPVLPLGRHLSM